MCEKMAGIYGVDIQKAKLVGIAHDIAKEFTKEQSLNYIKENNLEIDDMELLNISLVHGKIGADICKKLYGFDEEMGEAIKYHTTGKANMTMLTKILFIADLIEENRTFSDVENIRELAFVNLDEAILYCLELQIKKCIEKKRILHINTIYARNYLIKELI